MSKEKLISKLRPRSVQSCKLSTKDIIRLDLLDQIYYLVLLSGIDGKIGVMCSTTSLENMNIVVGRHFLIKNLVYQEEKSGVPVFKLTKSSLFRESNLAPKSSAEFNSDEVADLKLIDPGNYFSDPTTEAPLAPASTLSLLSLVQFLNMHPKDIKDSHFVEVIEQ